MSEELKPCPFCGDLDAPMTLKDAEETDDVWIVVCSIHEGGCGSSTGVLYMEEREAIRAWNSRPEGERKPIQSDNDVLDFALDFADWVGTYYDKDFIALGDSEHCHLSFALMEIIEGFTKEME